ncbi:hypothetical protein FACS189413_16820 [Bacteroidia bacterium]|nr:hypothetical protein FACS189413_16820 [Bacteroidia bacterium]
MNSNILNFNRIGLLFRRFFTEQLHGEAIRWAIMVIVFIFIRNFPTGIGLTIIISGAFFAASVFRNIHRPNDGNSYFMLPASQLEKWIVGLIIGIFYFFAMMILCYVTGNLLGTGLNYLLAQVPFFSDILPLFHTSDLHWVFFENISLNVNFNSNCIPESFPLVFALIFIHIQSLYLLGSVYFKHSQVWKTFFAWNIFQISLLIFAIVEMYIFKGETNISINNSLGQYNSWLEIAGNVGFAFLFYILPPIFWIISYFRLTEKQV